MTARAITARLRRQTAVIRRLHAGLAETTMTLIDDDDTTDTLRQDRRQGPEFVSP